MPFAKIDRDLVLDKIYECRGKIDPQNREALEKISELIDMIVYTEEPDPERVYPKIRIRR
jgi:hypothetical protein